MFSIHLINLVKQYRRAEGKINHSNILFPFKKTAMNAAQLFSIESLHLW